MVALVDVGISPVLRVPQYIDARGAPNLFAFRDAFEGWFGWPLNVTEGARSRPRQDLLWADWRRYVTYGGDWAPRAAIPYTSIHDVNTRALAVDLGSGLAVASTPQAKWARVNGPKYGVHPTGYSFGEPWHYEIRPGTQTITLAGNTGTQIGDTMSAEDSAALGRIESMLKSTHAGLWYGGKSGGKEFNYGALPVVTHNQTLIVQLHAKVGALTAAVAALAGGTSGPGGITAAQVEEAVNRAVADEFATLNANIDRIPTGFKLVADNGS